MMNRMILACLSLLVLILLPTLFAIKQKVMQLEGKLTEMKHKIKITNREKDLLQAEFHLLKNPLRIREMARQKLKWSNDTYQLHQALKNNETKQRGRA